MRTAVTVKMFEKKRRNNVSSSTPQSIKFVECDSRTMPCMQAEKSETVVSSGTREGEKEINI